MDAPALNSHVITKVIEYDGNTYICEFKINKESIDASIFLQNSLKFKVNITKKKIKSQFIFYDSKINEAFEGINQLDTDNFAIIKENNKYKLKIKIFIVFTQKYLTFDLEENKETNSLNNELVNYYEKIIQDKDKIILELKNAIKNKDAIIQYLEELIKNNNNSKIKIADNLNKKLFFDKTENYYDKKENFDKNKNLKRTMNVHKFGNVYNDFNIKFKNPIHKINIHTSSISCLEILKDGRLISGSYDSSMIIYNKQTYQPDIIIQEHNDSIYCINQLSTGLLASSSCDKTIKIFNIKETKYVMLQTLNFHASAIYKVIELKNKYLVSCSSDKSIIFYMYDHLEYQKDYQISTKRSCNSIIQTKDNEICYSEANNNTICFYDINIRKIKSTINNLDISNSCLSRFIMITKELLLIPGENKLSIINVYHYQLVRIIGVPNSSYIDGVCMLNSNMLLTGDNAQVIRQWRIDGDNLKLISLKENTHDSSINVLLNLGDGHIASGDNGNTIKIW